MFLYLLIHGRKEICADENRLDIALLYPRHCPICDGLLRRDEPMICRICAKELRFIQDPVCMKCGRPLSSDAGEYCRSCQKTQHSFTSGFSPFLYRDPVQNSLMHFKYGGRAEYARFYSAAILSHGQERLRLWKPQLILPVPVHPLRYLERGYNQAEELANCLSKSLCIPAASDLIRRQKNTRPQKRLDPQQRRKNLSGAFCTDPRALRKWEKRLNGFPERVLLCDDIYTTGTTMDLLAQEAKKCGAAEVYFVSISIAPGDG